MLYAAAFLVFSAVILYNFNLMATRLCIQKEIPEEKQIGVYRMINICITMLLLSSYIEVSLTY
ncbi:MAG: hypothetical protein ACI4XL_08000 [Bacillus sp. (in: firmicutes)]